ncbi:MAG: NAD(P)-dependent alcohol dehydrogenase [Deltaproteobacteria bacterium]|nr:NAD(P)-dependent alcohol dehydrogenase [Deltaproteobacteria bacterium]
MKIKAAVVREPSSPFVIEELELDEPRDNEILVRMVGTGLCSTDLTAQHGHLPVKFPGVFGHEGAGIVEKVGSQIKTVQPGDHVTMSYTSCGICNSCIKGHPTHCDHFFPFNFLLGGRPDGSPTMRKGDEIIFGGFFGQSSFATYALATERNTVKVPKDVPIEMLGPLGCALQTGAGGVFYSLEVKPGSSIAIFGGTGSVGVSAIMAAVVSGATKIIVVSRSDKKMKRTEQFGATHFVNSGKCDPVEEIKKITGGVGIDYSVECTARPEILRQAVDCLAMGGKCGLIGAAPMGTEVTFDMQTLLDGRSVMGIVEGDAVSGILIPKLIELYKQGRLPFDKMIEYYPFDQINQAVEDLQSGKVIKAVLKF